MDTVGIRPDVRAECRSAASAASLRIRAESIMALPAEAPASRTRHFKRTRILSPTTGADRRKHELADCLSKVSPAQLSHGDMIGSRAEVLNRAVSAGRHCAGIYTGTCRRRFRNSPATSPGDGDREMADVTATRPAPAAITSSTFASVIPPIANQGISTF